MRRVPARPAGGAGWRIVRSAGRGGIAPWLAEPGSLTARLRRHCEHFSLRRLRQGAHAPLADEARLFAPHPPRVVWAREVLLLADGRPVVWARSLVRQRALRDAWRMVGSLGLRPVGDAVFARPDISRIALRARALNPAHPLHRAACAAAGLTTGQPLWARRAAFVRAGQTLWVTEVFLPGVEALQPRPVPSRGAVGSVPGAAELR